MTGGGDCPGLNAVIRAVAKTAITDENWEIFGISDGYEGWIEGRGKFLSYRDVSGILTWGGTILGTSNKANPYAYYRKGSKKPADVSHKLVENYEKWDLDAVALIGGDGTLTTATKLYQEKRLPVVGIPKTIDNDLMETDFTFGFDSAVNCISNALDDLHWTAQSHHRIMIIEVMGRYAGWLALYGGLAGGGDIILIPEIPFQFDEIISIVRKREIQGKRFSIITAAEGAFPEKGEMTVKSVIEDSPDPIRLGGIGQAVKKILDQNTDLESRVTVLGHLQRGGTPTAFDRILSSRFGYHAIQLVKRKRFGRMVCLKGNEIKDVKLADAVRKIKKVDPEHSLIRTAQAIGTSFGRPE